jgi:hypothetical protein
MHLNVIRLEKAGLMDIRGLQKVMDIILDNYVMTDGRFPSGQEIKNDTDGDKNLSDGIGDLIAFLVKSGVLQVDDYDDQKPIELDQTIRIDFESEFISKTLAEKRKIKKILKTKQALSGCHMSAGCEIMAERQISV